MSLGSGPGVLEDPEGEVSNPLVPVQQRSGKAKRVAVSLAAPSPSSGLFSPRAAVSTRGMITTPNP